VSFTEVQNSLHPHITANSAFERDSDSISTAMSSNVADVQTSGVFGGQRGPHMALLKHPEGTDH
jgi:hypothetical protein